MSRVYVGRLPQRCSERDVERFFRDYGRIREIVLKNGYGFVEFDHVKDADDAVYDLNGRELRGERVVIEHAKLPPGSRESRGFSNYGSSNRFGARRESRYGPPTRTEHRAIIENLSSRISWQDLKDTMRKAGEVCYADAHRANKNEGIVEFRSREDLKAAIERFDGYELNGRKIRVVEDKRRRSSSRSSRGSVRKRSSRRSRSSRSRSRSGSRRRSVSRGRSASDRRRSVSNGKSRSRSRSVSRNGKSGSVRDTRSRSASRKSRSATPRRERSRSGTPDDRSRSSMRSRSGSRHSGSRDANRSGSASRSPSPPSDRE